VAGSELYEWGQGEGKLGDFGLEVGVLGFAGGEHCFGGWGCRCLILRIEMILKNDRGNGL